MSAVAQNLFVNLEESFLLFIESVPDAMVLSDRESQSMVAGVLHVARRAAPAGRHTP